MLEALIALYGVGFAVIFIFTVYLGMRNNPSRQLGPRDYTVCFMLAATWPATLLIAAYAHVESQRIIR